MGYPCTARLLLKRSLHSTPQCLHQEIQKKLLKVAIVGAPNAGKSTLLNNLIGYEISSVSKKVHTTRKNCLGVFTQDDTQLKFYDTPGLVTRKHLKKHELEELMLTEPVKASTTCDLIAVLIDASNIREQRRLNRGILDLLSQHSDKKSVLIMNKLDLIKDKKLLIDIGVRLSQGCLEGKSNFRRSDIRGMSLEEIKNLNLSEFIQLKTNIRPKHRFVEYLDSKYDVGLRETNYKLEPDLIGYKHFSNIFSISALENDGVDEIRNYFISQAKPVQDWPHESDYLTNLSKKEIVLEIIRGKVLNFAPKSVPYTVKYKFRNFQFDELGSLHINLSILCRNKYIKSEVIGLKGANILPIIELSRDAISTVLRCEVSLTITVDIDNRATN